MKNYYITLLLIFTSISTGYSEVQYFSSNAAGRILTAITKDEIDNYTYIAEVEYIGDKTIISIIKEEEKVSKILLLTTDEEKFEEYYQYEYLISKKKIVNKKVVYEEIYDEGKLRESRDIKYNENGCPDNITATDSKGKAFYIENFFYHSKGYLLQIKRVYSNKDVELIVYSYDSEGNIIDAFESFNNKSTFSMYNESKIIKEMQFKDKELTLYQEWNYSNGGIGLLEFDPASGFENQSDFDDNGNLIKFVEKGENFLKITEYYYKGELLISKKMMEPGILKLWNYKYDKDDNILYEEVFRNGTIIKTVDFLTEDKKIEYYYKNGLIFLKISYVDEVRVKQEYILSKD